MDFRVVVSVGYRSRATVMISGNGRYYAEAEAEGDGSVDALLRATDSAVGVRGQVVGIRIHAFDDYGMVGKAQITVAFEGREYGGRGPSPDAVEAAAHAYLRAVAAYLSDRAPKASTR